MLTRDNTYENFYVDGGDENRTVQQMMEQVYNDDITLNLSFWQEADLDTRFKVGDQTVWNELYGNLPAFMRRQLTFNRIRRNVNMVCGYQRRNRKSVVAIPVENSDTRTSSLYSEAIFWAWKQSQADEILSRAFEVGPVTTGLSLINVWMSFNSDPINGDIYCDAVPYNSFIIDPYFTKQDLSDCRHIWRRKWMSRDQLEAMFPSRVKEIRSLRPPGNTDGKFQFMAQAYNYGGHELHIYDELWYLDMRKQTILCDLQTGETIEWRGKKELLEQFLSMHPQIIARDGIVPTVKLAQSINNKTFYHGPNPLGIDTYPFVACLGYHEPEIPYFAWRTQGLVRGLRDAQFLYNRRKVIELKMLESQVTTGLKYKVNSLVNPDSVWLSGEGRGIALKDKAEMSDVEKIPAPDLPPTLLQLSQQLGEEIQQISGVNEELLGSAQDDKPGILSMLRQGAGLTTLQTLFDQFDTSTKLLGKLYLKLIQENFGPGKIKRITGEEPTAQFYEKAFGKYDVEIEEGFNTTTQRQYNFAQLLQLTELGIPIPPERLIQAATIQDKDEIIEEMKASQQQQQQMAMMQAQAQAQMQQAQMKLYESQANANESMGVERLSRVQENRALAVERISESRANRDKATLDLAKAVKELEQIDLNQIEKMFTLLNILKENSIEKDAEEATMMSEQIAQIPTPDLGNSLPQGAGLAANNALP